MKKIFVETLIGIVLLSSLSTVFASNIDCPSVKTIKNTELVYAQQDVSGIWGFESDYFTAQGKRWKLYFSTLLDDETHGSKILELGREIFKKLPLSEPKRHIVYHNLCIYRESDGAVIAKSFE